MVDVLCKLCLKLKKLEPVEVQRHAPPSWCISSGGTEYMILVFYSVVFSVLHSEAFYHFL